MDGLPPTPTIFEIFFRIRINLLLLKAAGLTTLETEVFYFPHGQASMSSHSTNIPLLPSNVFHAWGTGSASYCKRLECRIFNSVLLSLHWEQN